MEVSLTLKNVNALTLAMHETYGDSFLHHVRIHYRREMAPIYILGDTYKVWLRGKVRHMLNFKNDKGEIVMTENDKGNLAIHDDVLKESMEGQISLQEAKEKQSQKEGEE